MGYWSDDNKVTIGISICPKVSKEDRQKYIKTEEAEERMQAKKQKLQFHGSPRFNGNTHACPHASGTSGHGGSGSKRTMDISLILVVGIRWVQKWCGFSMDVMYHSMFFTPPIGMI